MRLKQCQKLCGCHLVSKVLIIIANADISRTSSLAFRKLPCSSSSHLVCPPSLGEHTVVCLIHKRFLDDLRRCLKNWDCYQLNHSRAARWILIAR